MRIDSLSLRNFRSYAAADVVLGPGLNISGGLNGAGKSTLLDALAVALTGTCRGAEAGRGLDDLRRYGDRKKWAVRVVAGGETFVRQEGEGPRAAVQQRIESVLGVPAPAIRACLYAGELLRLERKEAQRLILDLAKPAGIEIPAQVYELLATLQYVGAVSPGRLATLADLDRCYRDLYPRRTENGRLLKAIGTPESLAAPAALEGLSPGVMADQERVIRTKVADLQAKRDQAVQENADRQAAPAIHRARIAELDRMIADLSKRREALLPESEAGLRIAHLTRQVADAGSSRESYQHAHRDALARISAAGEGQRRTAADVAAIESAPEVCAACGAKVK